MSKEKTIKIRQAKLKKAVIEQLTRTPIIEIAVEKVGISRMTFYRWTKVSKQFAKEVEEALFEGRLFISDIAESQLFSLVKDKKIEAIKYVLRHNNPRYADRLELSGTVSTKDEPLTAEQKALIRQALKLSSLRNYEPNKKQSK